MICVAGATGFLGREICRRLTAQGRSVRALIRPTSDPDAVEQLRRWGAETVEADLKNRATLDAACRGAETVISTVTATRSRQPDDGIEATDQQGQLNLVDAAAAAGVRHFVYVSYSGGIDSDDPLTRAKRAVEERVRGSGMGYTILRPSYFMEVWLSPRLGFDYANGNVTIYGTGENRVSWISLADVAAFAVAAVDHPVVRIFEQAGGRAIEARVVPEEALRAQMGAATDSLTQAFSGLMLCYAAGDPIPMGATLQTYPMQLRSVRDYARAVSAGHLND
jgi:uncharacterized protein YbjT (DUF2867 family)